MVLLNGVVCLENLGSWALVNFYNVLQDVIMIDSLG